MNIHCFKLYIRIILNNVIELLNDKIYRHVEIRHTEVSTCLSTKIINPFLLKRRSKDRYLLIILVKLQCSMIDISRFSFSEHGNRNTTVAH